MQKNGTEGSHVATQPINQQNLNQHSSSQYKPSFTEGDELVGQESFMNKDRADNKNRNNNA